MKNIGAFLVIIGLFVLVGCATPEPVTQSAYRYSETVIGIPHGDYSIPATIVLPIGVTEAMPVVVMLHDENSNRNGELNSFVFLASDLARSGIASVRVDLPGSSNRDAENKSYSVPLALDEMNTILNHVIAIRGVDANRLVLLGWGKGASVALLATANYPDLVAALVSWAGMFTGEESDNMMNHVRDFIIPVLAVNAEDDVSVSPESGKYLVANSSTKKSEYVLLPLASHNFTVVTGERSTLQKAIDATVAWLMNVL